ncbi:unnamed protein product, partial [Polarella glacialis]
ASPMAVNPGSHSSRVRPLQLPSIDRAQASPMAVNPGSHSSRVRPLLLPSIDSAQDGAVLSSERLGVRRSQPDRLALIDNIKRNRRRLRASDDYGMCDQLDRQARRHKGSGPDCLPPASSSSQAGQPAGWQSSRVQYDDGSEPESLPHVLNSRPALVEDDVDEPFVRPPGRSPREPLSPLMERRDLESALLEDAGAPGGQLGADEVGLDNAAGQWVRQAVEQLTQVQGVHTRGRCVSCRVTLQPSGANSLLGTGLFCNMACFGIYALEATMSRLQQDRPPPSPESESELG